MNSSNINASIKAGKSVVPTDKRQNQEKFPFPIRSIAEVISSLANEDAIKIFYAAKDGITSSTKAIKELELTQKRYYTWLKRLIDVGLIEKRKDTYVQTALGNFCYKLGQSFSNVLNQRNQLELADKLMKSDLSIDEKEEVLRAISKKELLGTASLADVIHEVKMIDNYDYLINEVIRLVNTAQESVYVAAHRTDQRVSEAMINAVERDVKFHFLGGEERQFSERVEALKMILSPSMIKLMRKLLSSREIRIKSAKLSYSFCVVDEKNGIIELPHPARSDFYVGFEFKNEFFCKKLIETFNSLYEKGKPDPMLEFVNKYFRLYK